ncbi:TRAP transporter substrate-binding protein [Faecalicatena contorta]|uniref:TRAP transporter substrate-binding protein n=1 Tax=Faecalicatena contorta TaxID=39482 RepID=UPI001F273CE6|nr:TRAP transporter substrate-binding protein [Faecalicatena contorta]MCF2682299.1 TRAP transporter substrate-binding protein [Faecalicatena contorta]
MNVQKIQARIVSAGLILAMAAALLFTGCNRSGETDVQRYAWPLATASPEDTVTQIFAEKFAEEVSRLSDGQMKIQVYPNSTLGGDRDLLETCADGDIPFVVQNTAPQVTFMPDLAVFDLPCVFDTLEECREAIDDPTFYGLISDVYTNGGYHLLGMADQGFRVMSTNKKITTVDDFRGQKIRTMENSYHLAFWESLNANPAPMSFSEVYIGLQQHTIDAQENPYEVIVSNKLYEQQDYIIETNHLPHLISLIVNDSFFQDLSEEEQEIMTQAAQIATEYARRQSDERIADRIAAIEDNGTQIITLSDEVRNEIREKSQTVYDSIEANISEDIYNAYLGLQ